MVKMVEPFSCSNSQLRNKGKSRHIGWNKETEQEMICSFIIVANALASSWVTPTQFLEDCD
jgi:hypothetical protein